MAKRLKTGSSRRPPEKRQDVTRLEYETVCEAVEKNREAIRRLEMQLSIQFQRTAEQQTELDILKKSGSKK